MKHLLPWWLQVVLTPTCWLQNEHYSHALDTLLIKWLDDGFAFQVAVGRYDEACQYYATINGVTLWVANHPYASFTPWPSRCGRPSRRTILRAHERLVKDILERKLYKQEPNR